MELRISARCVDEVTVIDCAGRVFGEQGRSFRNTLGALLAGANTAVLNLDGISSMDSWGMTALMALCLSARRNGTTITLAGVRPALSEMFRLYNLLASFEMYESVDAALSALRKGAPV